MPEKKKIVVMDDESDLVFLIQSLLSETELYDVIPVLDPKKGIDIICREIPDLVLLDFVMPDLTGDKVIEMLHKDAATKRIPVVLMSGLGEMVYIRKKDAWKWLPNNPAAKGQSNIPDVLKWEKAPERIAEKYGIHAFLAKPFTEKVLLDVVKTILTDATTSADDVDPDSV